MDGDTASHGDELSLESLSRVTATRPEPTEDVDETDLNSTEVKSLSHVSPPPSKTRRTLQFQTSDSSSASTTSTFFDVTSLKVQICHKMFCVVFVLQISFLIVIGKPV